jgi:hypothetical protein
MFWETRAGAIRFGETLILEYSVQKLSEMIPQKQVLTWVLKNRYFSGRAGEKNVPK